MKKLAFALATTLLLLVMSSVNAQPWGKVNLRWTPAPIVESDSLTPKLLGGGITVGSGHFMAGVSHQQLTTGGLTTTYGGGGLTTNIDGTSIGGQLFLGKYTYRATKDTFTLAPDNWTEQPPFDGKESGLTFGFNIQAQRKIGDIIGYGNFRFQLMAAMSGEPGGQRAPGALIDLEAGIRFDIGDNWGSLGISSIISKETFHFGIGVGFGMGHPSEDCR